MATEQQTTGKQHCNCRSSRAEMTLLVRSWVQLFGHKFSRWRQRCSCFLILHHVTEITLCEKKHSDTLIAAVQKDARCFVGIEAEILRQNQKTKIERHALKMFKKHHHCSAFRSGGSMGLWATVVCFIDVAEWHTRGLTGFTNSSTFGKWTDRSIVRVKTLFST